MTSPNAELERQGTRAHATRNWVFLHGTADQFRHPTERMLELEQEYLRRHPKRTWQGAGGDASPVDRVEQLRQLPPLLATAAPDRFLTEDGRRRLADDDASTSSATSVAAAPDRIREASRAGPAGEER